MPDRVLKDQETSTAVHEIKSLESEKRAMPSILRFILCSLCLYASAALMPTWPVAAQSTTPVSPPALTIQGAKDFLTAAGLQTCEINEMDPMVSQIHRTTKSLSIGVAKDCSTYDHADPTVVNVHQFADQESRDAMVVALQDLRFRALRPYADVWVVDNFVIVLLGPQRDEIEALIKA